MQVRLLIICGSLSLHDVVVCEWVACGPEIALTAFKAEAQDDSAEGALLWGMEGHL